MHTHPQSLSLCHKLSSPFRYLLAESIDDDVAGNNALIAPGRRTLRLDPADSQAHEQREAEDAGQTALQLATAATNHINLGPVRTDPPNGDAQPANSAPPCSLLSSIEKRNKGLSTFTMFLVFQVYVNSMTNRHRRAPYQSNRYFISLKKTAAHTAVSALIPPASSARPSPLLLSFLRHSSDHSNCAPVRLCAYEHPEATKNGDEPRFFLRHADTFTADRPRARPRTTSHGHPPARQLSSALA